MGLDLVMQTGGEWRGAGFLRSDTEMTAEKRTELQIQVQVYLSHAINTGYNYSEMYVCQLLKLCNQISVKQNKNGNK